MRAQNVGLAHSPEVAHQVQRAFVSDGDPVAIGNRKRQTGPLNKGTQTANVTHGCNARGQTVTDFGLSRGHGIAKFKKRLTAKECCDKKTIGSQRMAGLHQLTDWIVHCVKV